MFQYVNHMYERITGFSNEELVGKDSRELCLSERNKDLHEIISAQTKKGKVSTQLSCQLLPESVASVLSLIQI